jgi:hypothetical protein
VCGGGGEGEGKVVEQQTGALGNPCSSFSSSSSSLCIRWGFDKIFTLGNAVQMETVENILKIANTIAYQKTILKVSNPVKVLI